mmetsp:Transcript_37595/g.70199  ORF Transcript_37595/g.70199 Transcript_37595/m.70199 type:complete len:1042 (+) Transcript_37595:144-3269(+)
MLMHVTVLLQLVATLSSDSKQTCKLPDIAKRATKRKEDLQFLQYRKQRTRFDQPSLLEDNEDEWDGVAEAADEGGSRTSTIGSATENAYSAEGWVDLPWAGLRERFDDVGKVADIEESKIDGHFFSEGELAVNQQMLSLLTSSQDAAEAVEQTYMRDVPRLNFKTPSLDGHDSVTDDEECSFTRAPSCEHMATHNCTNPKSLSQFCPKDCSYVLVDPLFSCEAACVKPSKCDMGGMTTTYDNPETHVCEAGPIEGCQTYGPHDPTMNASGAQVKCDQCSHLFRPQDGGCIFFPGYRTAALVVLICVSVLLAFILPLNLYRRLVLPIGDPEVVNYGWNFRERCLVARDDYNNPDTQHSAKYPLVSTNMRKENIAGPGLCLFYNSLVFLLGVAVLVAITSTIFYIFFSNSFESGIESGIDLGQSHCSASRLEDVGKNLRVSQGYCAYVFGGLWFCLLLGSLFYARQQRLAHRQFDAETSLMADFASRAVGFPPDATEAEIKSFFNQIEPASVFGVSLAYDYRHHKKTVEALLSQQLSEQDIQQRSLPLKHKMEPPVDGDRLKIKQMLMSLKGSGTAFPVSGNEEDRHRLMEAFDKTQPLFRGRWRITMAHIREEPTTFFWENFIYDRKTHVVYGVMETCLLLLEAFLLGLVFFLPAAYFLYSWSKARGVGEASLSSTVIIMVVGYLITIMNVILYVLVDFGCHRVGFYYKVDIDRCNLVGATLIVGVSTVFSLAMSVTAVHSADLHIDDRLFTDQTRFKRSLREESIDMIEAEKLFELLVPGILVLPDLLGRLIKYVFSAKDKYNYLVSIPFIFKWDMRSNVDLTMKEAEEGLLPPPMQIEFDYANAICIFGTAFVMLALPGIQQVYTAWILVFWAVMSYVTLKYCHLRCNKFTEYTSCFLDDCATRLWGIPLSILATVAVHWANRAWSWRLPIVGYIGVFLVSFIFYSLLVGLVLEYSDANDHGGTTDYVKTVKMLRYNYFNTNPIHVLKTVYLKEYGPPLVYFQRGKGHLQKPRKDPFAASRLELYEIDNKLCSPESRTCC